MRRDGSTGPLDLPCSGDRAGSFLRSTTTANSPKSNRGESCKRDDAKCHRARLRQADISVGNVDGNFTETRITGDSASEQDWQPKVWYACRVKRQRCKKLGP